MKSSWMERREREEVLKDMKKKWKIRGNTEEIQLTEDAMGYIVKERGNIERNTDKNGREREGK